MLVLSRRIGESIKIGDETTIRIVGVNGNVVRVGVDAPDKVPVHREEIHRKIKAAVH